MARWLEANVEGFRGPFTLTKFPSGQSNPTYKITRRVRATMCCGASRSGRCCPRRMRSTANTGCLRRFTRSAFRCPSRLALCDDPAVIGAIFYVMEVARGRPYADGALPDFDPATRRRMYEQLVDTLAELHCIDPDAAGLGDFGKPGNYFERQVARWTRQYRDSQTDYHSRDGAADRLSSRNASRTVAHVDRPRRLPDRQCHLTMATER